MIETAAWYQKPIVKNQGYDNLEVGETYRMWSAYFAGVLEHKARVDRVTRLYVHITNSYNEHMILSKHQFIFEKVTPDQRLGDTIGPPKHQKGRARRTPPSPQARVI